MSLYFIGQSLQPKILKKEPFATRFVQTEYHYKTFSKELSSQPQLPFSKFNVFHFPSIICALQNFLSLSLSLFVSLTLSFFFLHTPPSSHSRFCISPANIASFHSSFVPFFFLIKIWLVAWLAASPHASDSLDLDLSSSAVPRRLHLCPTN